MIAAAPAVLVGPESSESPRRRPSAFGAVGLWLENLNLRLQVPASEFRAVTVTACRCDGQCHARAGASLPRRPAGPGTAAARPARRTRNPVAETRTCYFSAGYRLEVETAAAAADRDAPATASLSHGPARARPAALCGGPADSESRLRG